MEQIAQVYGRSLFEVAKERGTLDVVGEQLGQVADAVEGSADMRLFLFSPYFSTEEKKAGLKRAVRDADPAVANLLALLAENHRLPVIFRIRREYQRLWDEDRDLLPVTVTSAVPLDASVTDRIGEQIGRQTGRNVQLSTAVDPSIVGGFVVRVGNAIVDASIRNRLEHFRKQVAQA
ncbi:MAG TPA: ATP synthase F1 subunit delta [Solirubrobacteraceae bacterium]|nr:ATP synthase F1 subunit delta [Solirubrobacteraceae bacterium]